MQSFEITTRNSNICQSWSFYSVTRWCIRRGKWSSSGHWAL